MHAVSWVRLNEAYRRKGAGHKFLAELFKFEHELPYDGNTIEGRYNRLIHSLIEKS